MAKTANLVCLWALMVLYGTGMRNELHVCGIRSAHGSGTYWWPFNVQELLMCRRAFKFDHLCSLNFDQV